mgnify:CR=1 FL=1
MMTKQELFDYACYLRHGTMPVAVAYDLWRVCIGRFNDIPWAVVEDFAYLSPKTVVRKYGLVQRVDVAEYVSERRAVLTCRQCARADKRA